MATDDPFCAVLGGTETFGKSVAEPYPSCLARLLGHPVVNLGCAYAGLDALVEDPAVMALCARAQATVVQVLAAQNLSNTHYSVHPRRNDRFIAARGPLKQLYPEVDFTEFHFTGHMLAALYVVSPARFEAVRAAIHDAWLARMEQLAAHLSGPSVLLWVAGMAPPDALGAPDALCVDQALLAQVRGLFRDYVQVVFHPADAQVAAGQAALPDGAAHDHVARELAPVMDRLIAY